MLNVKPDSFTLEMAVLLREGSESLRAGFEKFSENAALAESDMLAARKSERSAEKVYRKAQAELFDISDYAADMRAKKKDLGEEVEAEILAPVQVIDVFKKRGVYRHMSNAADRVARAGATSHDISLKIA